MVSPSQRKDPLPTGAETALGTNQPDSRPPVNDRNHRSPTQGKDESGIAVICLEDENPAPTADEPSLKDSGASANRALVEPFDLDDSMATEEEDLSSSNEAEEIRRRQGGDGGFRPPPPPTLTQEERRERAREKKRRQEQRKKERNRAAKAQAQSDSTATAAASRPPGKRDRSESATPPTQRTKASKATAEAASSREGRVVGPPEGGPSGHLRPPPPPPPPPPPRGQPGAAESQRTQPTEKGTPSPRPGPSDEAPRPVYKGARPKERPNPLGGTSLPSAPPGATCGADARVAQPRLDHSSEARGKHPGTRPTGPTSTDRGKAGPSSEHRPKGKQPAQKADCHQGRSEKGGLTYAGIVRSNLTLTVSSPTGEEPLAEEDNLAIQGALIEAIADEPADAPPRQFEGVVSEAESISIRCSDESTFKWARQFLSSFPRRGEQGRTSYRVSSPRDRPPFRVFKVWVPIPGFERSRNRVPHLLGKQNPGLNATGLRVRGNPFGILKTGFHLNMEVDESLLPELERLGLRPKLGLARATFRPHGEGGGNDGGAQGGKEK